MTQHSIAASPLLFLSHSAADTQPAVDLALRIEAAADAQRRGLRVWVDKRDLHPGIDWKQQLQDALHRSTACAVYVGSNGVVNWVWDEVSAALDRAHRDPSYLVVPVLANGTRLESLPPFLSRFHGVAGVERDPDAFERLVACVLGQGPREPVQIEDDPFQGLEAFSTARTHVFFGRETETEELVQLVRAQHLVMVVGDSGSGKSSLVKAGLVPRFRGGAFAKPAAAGPDDTIWQVVETRPLTNPFETLAESVRDTALGQGIEPQTCSGLAELVRTARAPQMKDALQMASPPGAKLLLIVDQFEELFTLAEPRFQEAFADALVSLADPNDDRIRVVLTMRWDYYHLCSDVPSLYARLEASDRGARYTLRRMSPEAVWRCITEPLRLAAIPESERDELARAIVPDVEERPNDLALLSMALRHTWERRREYGGSLVRGYVAIGRVDGALATAAERVYNDLPPAEQALAEPLFVRLVKLGDLGAATRRVADREELDTDRGGAHDPVAGDDGKADAPSATRWRLAQKLARKEFSRLIVVAGDSVEIAHEALVRSWPRYFAWLRNDKIQGDYRGDDKRRLDGLIDDVDRWRRAPATRRRQLLAKRSDLETYQSLAQRRATWLAPREWTYLRDSERAFRLSQWSQRAAVALLVVFAAFSVWQWRSAQNQLSETTASLAWRDLDLRSGFSDAAVRSLWTVATAPDGVRSRFIRQLRETPPLQLQSGTSAELIVNATVGLDPDTAVEFSNVLLGVLKQPEVRFSTSGIDTALVFVEGRLPTGERLTAWTQTVEAIEAAYVDSKAGTPSERSSSGSLLAGKALAQRLSTEQRQQAWRGLMTSLKPAPTNGPRDEKARRRRDVLAGAARWLAPFLRGDDAAAGFGDLVELIQSTDDDDELWRLDDAASGIAKNLSAEQAQRAWPRLFKSVITHEKNSSHLARAALPLAPHLSNRPELVAWPELLGAINADAGQHEMRLLAKVVEVLPGGPAEMIDATYERVLKAIETIGSPHSQNVEDLEVLAVVAAALGPELPNARAADAWSRIAGSLRKVTGMGSPEGAHRELASALAAVAERVPAEAALQTWSVLVDVAGSEWDGGSRQPLTRAAAALAKQLPETDRQRALTQVLSDIRRRGGDGLDVAGAAAASMLPQKDVAAAWKAVFDAMKAAIAARTKANADDLGSHFEKTLKALALRLPAENRSQAWDDLIDTMSTTRSFGDGPDWEEPAAALATVMTDDQRSQAWMRLIAVIESHADPRRFLVVVNDVAETFREISLAAQWADVDVLVKKNSGALGSVQELRSVLAERLLPEEAARSWPVLVEAMAEATEFKALEGLGRALVRSIPHLGTAADASWAHLLARIRASTNPDALQALAEVARAFPPRISDDETTSLWSHARQLIRSTADVSRLPDIASAITALPGRPNATISNEIWEDLTARLEAAADRGDLAGLVAAAASLVHAPIVPPGDIRRRERQARDAIRIWLAIDVYADRDDVTKAFAAAHTGQPIGDFAHDMLELLKYPTISQRVSDSLVALLRDEAKRQGAAFEGDLGAALEWAARNRYPIDRSSRPRHPCSTDTISIGMCGPFVQKTRVALIPFLGEAQ